MSLGQARYAECPDRFQRRFRANILGTDKSSARSTHIKLTTLSDGALVPWRAVAPLFQRDNIMEHTIHYVAVKTVARLAQTTPDAVRSMADRCNFRVLTRRGEPYMDADDIQPLLGIIHARQPEAALQDGDI
jgi:hypothetical protein